MPTICRQDPRRTAWLSWRRERRWQRNAAFACAKPNTFLARHENLRTRTLQSPSSLALSEDDYQRQPSSLWLTRCGRKSSHCLRLVSLTHWVRRRTQPGPDRGYLAGVVSGWLLSGRACLNERDGWYRPGSLGYQGQKVRSSCPPTAR